MARFFVDANEMQDDNIVLRGENAAHAKVLRLKAGEHILVCDGNGNDCTCVVVSVSPSEVNMHVIARQQSTAEAAVKASIYLGFPKADKLEHVIQKATELGAYEIVAFPTARCISKPDEKSLSKKIDRWQKIAFSAAEQCGRGLVPKIVILPSYSDALMRAKEADKTILFYENEYATTLHMALADCEYSSISLITGPEGGFEVHEVSQAKELGIQICTLGKRILRCETAPLCALSAVMYASGEF